MNHRSIPSLSSSISSVNTNTTTLPSQPPLTPLAPPRNSISSSSSPTTMYYQQYFPITITPTNKRYSEPSTASNNKRWDDSQLEMELAEDDLIFDNKKVRRNSSLRFKQQLSSAESYFIDKFRHNYSKDSVIEFITIEQQQKPLSTRKKFSCSIKKVYDWLF